LCHIEALKCSTTKLIAVGLKNLPYFQGTNNGKEEFGDRISWEALREYGARHYNIGRWQKGSGWQKGSIRAAEGVKSKYLTFEMQDIVDDMARPLRVEFEDAIYHLGGGRRGQI
jgi:hypothetical protein